MEFNNKPAWLVESTIVDVYVKDLSATNHKESDVQ